MLVPTLMPVLSPSLDAVCSPDSILVSIGRPVESGKLEGLEKATLSLSLHRLLQQQSVLLVMLFAVMNR